FKHFNTIEVIDRTVTPFQRDWKRRFLRHNFTIKRKSPLKFTLSGLCFNNPGGFLLSHAVARAVPSAPRGLTSVFGMGTGVALSTQPPENSNAGVRAGNQGSDDATQPSRDPARIIFHLSFQI